MKVIIQLPSFNEESTLGQTIRDLPKSIGGIEVIELLVVDDGSTDRTSEVAEALGVHHILRMPSNQGLARAFSAGVERALELGADIIVNTDADNQYCGADVEALVRPILQRQADIVVGARDIANIAHFSFVKKVLQRVGSYIVRTISNTSVPDVTSGFRAYTREAAMRLNILSEFTYTLETIIQSGLAGLRIVSVPVRTNAKLRESRLFSSIPEYVLRSFVTILRVYTMYKPLRVFSLLSLLFLLPGLGLLVRFMYYYLKLPLVQTGHVQSLIIAAVLLIVGFQVFLFGIVADVTAKNRKLLENILLKMKRTSASTDTAP
jgi:glycosyltransferase involved in cell wall biosynthesis